MDEMLLSIFIGGPFWNGSKLLSWSFGSVPKSNSILGWANNQGKFIRLYAQKCGGVVKSEWRKILFVFFFPFILSFILLFLCLNRSQIQSEMKMKLQEIVL